MLRNLLFTVSQCQQYYARHISFKRPIVLIKVNQFVVYARGYCDDLKTDPDCSDSLLTDEMIERISAGKEDVIDKLKQLEFEVINGRQSGRPVPSKLRAIDWEQLLCLKSSRQKSKFLEFLHRNELIKQKEKLEKEQKRKEWEICRLEKLNNGQKDEKPTTNQDLTAYGLGKNTIMIKLTDARMHAFYHNRCFNSLMYGVPIVYDLGFHDRMTPSEQRNVAVQLLGAFSSNREHKDPFYMQLLNADPNSLIMKVLQVNNPAIHRPEFPIDVSSQSYLDIYPREKLIFLTPDAKDEMVRFDPEIVYIIGGIVDKSDTSPISVAKAKRENVKTLRLPLNRYLAWGSSDYSLTLDQMMKIMLEMKTSGDWIKALRHVPSRKIKTERELEVESQYRLSVMHLLFVLLLLSFASISFSRNFRRRDPSKFRRTMCKMRYPYLFVVIPFSAITDLEFSLQGWSRPSWQRDNSYNSAKNQESDSGIEKESRYPQTVIYNDQFQPTVSIGK